MSDYISRADAIEAACEECSERWKHYKECDLYKDGQCFEITALMALPSAYAVPTVIRAKTFMRKEDFDKWAEDIKKQNKSIVCIPCDAEVVSADAVQGEWIHDGQNFKGGLDWCHCSECGYKTSTNGLSVYRYCPSCGARMKGGAE